MMNEWFWYQKLSSKPTKWHLKKDSIWALEGIHITECGVRSLDQYVGGWEVTDTVPDDDRGNCLRCLRAMEMDARKAEMLA